MKTGYRYSWGKATIYANNVILGKIWINVSGEIDIINHNTNDICHINFFPYSTFSRNPPNRVSAIIKDNSTKAKYFLDGLWTDKIMCSGVLNEPNVLSFENHEKFLLDKSEVLWERELPP